MHVVRKTEDFMPEFFSYRNYGDLKIDRNTSIRLYEEYKLERETSQRHREICLFWCEVNDIRVLVPSSLLGPAFSTFVRYDPNLCK